MAARALLEKGPDDEVVELPSAPMPVIAGEEDDFEGDGPSMQDVLKQAGAKRDRKGWYREVPDPRVAKERVVVKDPESGQLRVFYQTTLMRRRVAVGNDWAEALEKARADANGMTDAYVPGRGWYRCGRKPESERPENLGDLERLNARTRTVLEEAPVDSAEAERAAALVQAAAAARGAGPQQEG